MASKADVDQLHSPVDDDDFNRLRGLIDSIGLEFKSIGNSLAKDAPSVTAHLKRAFVSVTTTEFEENIGHVSGFVQKAADELPRCRGCDTALLSALVGAAQRRVKRICEC
jgi:hypothetical protein